MLNAPRLIEVGSYLILAAYLVGFLLLSQRAAAVAARSVWLFGKGPARQKLSSSLFRVAFVGSAAWPLVQISSHASPAPRLGVPFASRGIALGLVGATMTVAGVAIALYSQRYMGASWRIGTTEGELGAIIDSGPFAVSRNPVFMGQAVLFVGLFLVFPGIVQGLLTLSLLIAIRLQVHIEEQALAATHGESYHAYLRRVRRWIGLPARSAQPSAVESSGS